MVLNRKPLKLVVCMSLIVALAISALGISVWASFENTHNNSGNQADDIVGVAQTQVGYAEGYNSYTKYGDWYGLPNSDWCAMFVSWCANQAGVDNNVFPSFALCSAGCDWFIKQGRFHYSGSYAPQAGDLIFYASYGNIYHVGLVTGSDGSNVYSIEGNYNEQVSNVSYSLGYGDILGYASPDYSTADNTTPAAADSDVEEDSDEEFFEDSDITEIETNDAYSYIDDEDTDSEEEYTYDSEVIADSDSEIETDVSDNTDSDDVTTDTDDIIEEDSETDSVADSDSEADTDSSIESDVETDTAATTADSDIADDTDTNTDSDTAIEVESDTDTDTEVTTDSDVDSAVDTDSDDSDSDNIEIGDVNGDGKINSFDALLVQRYLLYGDKFDKINTGKADLNGSGDVDIGDAFIILKMSVHLI